MYLLSRHGRASMKGTDPEIEEGGGIQQSRDQYGAHSAQFSGGMLSPENIQYDIASEALVSHHNQAKVNVHWSLTRVIADSWCGRSRSTLFSESALYLRYWYGTVSWEVQFERLYVCRKCSSDSQSCKPHPSQREEGSGHAATIELSPQM